MQHLFTDNDVEFGDLAAVVAAAAAANNKDK